MRLPCSYVELFVGSKKEGTYHDFSQDNQLVAENDYVTRYSLDKFNYGFQGAIGIQFQIGQIDLFIRSTYRFGLREIGQDYSEIYNRYFMLTFGLSL